MTSIGTFMALATMSVLHGAIVHVADDFEYDPNFKTEFTFNDTVAGGWAPPAPGGSTALESSEAAAEEQEAAAARRRAERAGLPWYRRSRAFNFFVGPLLLPAPMKLY